MVNSLRTVAAFRTICLVGLLFVLRAGRASAQDVASLTITVLDPSGAVVVGAAVHLAPERREAVDVLTGPDGTARLAMPAPAKVDVRVESPGFEPAELSGLSVRRSTTRTVKLKLAKVVEVVEVGRDPRERASDPRSDVFSTILGAAEIRELPDDPDEMERVLKDMAGPGAVMRVNGFRGGRMPPKDQIAQIRFHRNMFAADVHEPGFLAVDIITKPGFESWRGQTGVGLRDAAFNARNAFAPERGDERNARGSMSISGPLWRTRTSLSLGVDATDAYDSQTIVAATPEGGFRASVRRPNELANLSARLEHSLSSTQQMRVEWQQNHKTARNLGVGNFDLESRAYSQTSSESVLRGSVAGSLGKSRYNEARVSLRHRALSSSSALHAATLTVLNAFSSGGAQIDGARSSTEFELADDLDVSMGRHALRAGILLESGRYATSEWTNALGTYTFADLADYSARRATTFTRTVGDPSASLVHTQLATYFQDDIRISRTLTVSGGVRQEFQSRIGGVNLGPRGGIAWSPFKSGRTTVRAGAGIFFDWLDAESSLRAAQLDGDHLRVETIRNPGWPADANGSGGAVLSGGRVTFAADLQQPMLKEMNAGVEQAVGSVRLGAMLSRRRGTHQLRGIDINAPVDGRRPFPELGPVTQVRASAASGADALSLNLNFARPERRIFVAAHYMLSRAFNDGESPFSLPADALNISAERGPAADDARHRAMGFASVPVAGPVMAGVSFTARSALPYDITTGRDDNGDTLSTDRPAGTTRNIGRGRAQYDISARLSWRVGFGGAPPRSTGGPQVRVVRGGSDANPLADMPGGDAQSRYTLELYAQAFNLTNHTNAVLFSGVLTSPFFGQAVAASAPRRLELGARLSF